MNVVEVKNHSFLVPSTELTRSMHNNIFRNIYFIFFFSEQNKFLRESSLIFKVFIVVKRENTKSRVIIMIHNFSVMKFCAHNQDQTGHLFDLNVNEFKMTTTRPQNFSRKENNILYNFSRS